MATTTVSSAQSNTAITSGNTFDVVAGGSLTSDTIQAGGSATIETGATDNATTIQAGGSETVLGTATGDKVSGTQLVSAATAVVSNETVFGGGAIDLFLKGAVASNTTISSGGSLVISGNAVASNTVVSAGGSIVMQSAKAVLSGTVTFAGAGTITETVVVSTGSGYGTQAVISGFSAGDVIDLTAIGTGATITSAVSGANTVVTVSSGGAALENLTFAGTSYAANYFALSNDTATGVQITAGTPCYCPGTLIATGAGEVPVEALAIGDRVRTVSGALRPIKWIGRRAYGARFAAGQTQILPVRITAGAIDDGVPARDLFVSPLHAMFIDGVLLPALHLVNGTSVVQLESVDTVEYVHIELETHDVILAEGAASETFIDDQSRGMFHNAAEFAALYPDMVAQPARYCAPRVEEGEVLAAIRRKMAARAKPALAAWGDLDGSIDVVTRSRIAGWAFDAARPDQAVRLQVTADGVVVCELVADAYRPDLAEAGIGDGCHSFDVTVPGGLPDAAAIRVVRVADGAALPACRVA